MAMAGLLVKTNETNYDPVWALSHSARSGMGKPTLDHEPPVNSPPPVVGKPVKAFEEKKPATPVQQAHAAFLAEIDASRTAFKEKLNTRRTPNEQVQKTKKSRKKV